MEKNWFEMSHNYVTVHVTGTSALDITVARTPQIPVLEKNWLGMSQNSILLRNVHVTGTSAQDIELCKGLYY